MPRNHIVAWRLKYFGPRASLMLTSVFIGLLTALCAVVLKNGVSLIRNLIYQISIHQHLHFLLFVFPALGIFLTVLFAQAFLGGHLGRGVANIIYTISRKASRVERDKLYSQMVSSILTVGFGGSAGLEAPIASTGSAIGSHAARWLRFNEKERTLLLACGAAAGISAIFNAPIAGVIFAFEILLVDMPIPVIIPLLIASASSSLLSHLIFSGQPFVLIADSWQPDHLLYYIAFGCVAAFVSVYAIRVYFAIGEFFAGKKWVYTKAIVGGLLLGTLIFFFPPLYGEGYESVQMILRQTPTDLLNDQLLIPSAGIWTISIFAICLMLLKVIATSLTVGAGGNGGMFGSSLFTGAMCGYAFAHIVNLSGLATLNEVNFAVIGMAALMAGIIHAPLTAIFLIAEITGGYALFVPLMIVSSLSYMITRYFEPYSVYTKKLAVKGDMIIHDKDKVILSKMHLKYFIENDFISVKPNDTLGSLVEVISQSHRNLFPVVDDEGKLFGIVNLDDVRNIMFSSNLYEKILVKDLMNPPVVTLEVHQSMESALEEFEKHKAWNLPVVEDGKYAGFVSKSKIFTHYRQRVIKDNILPA